MPIWGPLNEKLSSRSSSRLRNVSKIDYKLLHQGRIVRSDTMSTKPDKSTKQDDLTLENVVEPLQNLQGASGGPGDFHSKPRSDDEYVTENVEDHEIADMERELLQLRAEENRLKLATQKDGN